jgi:hypothetical protein
VVGVEVVVVGVEVVVVGLELLVTGVALPPPLALLLVVLPPLDPQPTATAAIRANAATTATARYENLDQLSRSISSSCSTE